MPILPTVFLPLQNSTHWERIVNPDNIPDLTSDEWLDLIRRVRGAELREPLEHEADALAYAERVIRSTNGDAAFTEQAPYVVENRGTAWFVQGTRSRLPGVLDPVHVELRKSDATVIDFGNTGLNGMKAPPAPPDP